MPARDAGAVLLKGEPNSFAPQRGFGFIQPDDGSKDVFVHVSAVERAGMSNLNEGQKISYEVVADRTTGKSSADIGREVPKGLLLRADEVIE